MRDKDQISLQNLYENRILSEISQNYHNSPDKGNKKEKKRKGYLFIQEPKSTRGLKPIPQVSGPFETPERINLEDLDSKERAEYKNHISSLRTQIVAVAQDPDSKIPENSRNKLETLLNDRSLCLKIIRDLVLGIRSDDKHVKLIHPIVSSRDYPNGDPLFNILKDGENKFVLVLGIKDKFVSGRTNYSDIKYKIV
jgi:hypothetical protein